MTTVFKMSVADTDSFLLGEKSIRVTDPENKKNCSWQIAKENKPHPAVCPSCGRVINPNLWNKTTFCLHKRKFDIGSTYDGGHIVSDRAKEFLIDNLSCKLDFTDLPTATGFHYWDVRSLPSLVVDTQASQIRRGHYCDSCEAYSEVLMGLEPGTPPTVLPLKFRSAPEDDSLYRTDLAFGSNHGQWFNLVVTEGFARRINNAKLKEVYIVENTRWKAGKPRIRKF